jgi:hypothetical protein
MNPNLQVPKIFSQKIRISHIKVPEFQMTKHGTEIIKAKKIQVTPVKKQTRSESVRCNFRRVFHIPKANPNKENRNDEVGRVDRSQEAPRHKSLCRGSEGKLERALGGAEGRQNNQEKVMVPKIRLGNVPVNTSFLNHGKRIQEDLITFRPEVTPSRKDGRFPRDVFCIDSKRRF